MSDDAQKIEEARQKMIAKRFGGNKDGAQSGGKGSMRRKKKVVHKQVGEESKKLDAQLKKMNLQPLGQIDETNFICDNGAVYHFDKPKVTANIQQKTFVIQSNHEPEIKTLEKCGPEILPQLGPEYLRNLQEFAKQVQQQQASKLGKDGIPETVEEEDDDNDDPPPLEEIDDGMD